MGLVRWIRQRLGADEQVLLEIPLSDVGGQLLASAMPFGPYDRGNKLLRRYREAGIDYAVSLVTDEEIARKAKRDLWGAYRKAGIQSIRFPITDLTSPQLDPIRRLIAQVRPLLQSGHKVVVHCNAGTGRTAVVTSCLVAELCGMDGQSAIAFIETKMATQITESQRRVVQRFAADGNES